MPAPQDNWNININDAWNRAILTPNGIGTRLLHLPANAPLEVELAVDKPGRFRVVHEGSVIVPTSSQLQILVQNNDSQSLINASLIGKEALTALPETPVSAVGINIRYPFNTIPNGLIDLLETPIDARYSDAGRVIQESITLRSLTFQQGIVNVQIRHRDDWAVVEMNYHYSSTDSNDLAAWLDMTNDFCIDAQQLIDGTITPTA